MAERPKLGLDIGQDRLSKITVLIGALGPVGTVIGGLIEGMLADVRYRRIEEFVEMLATQLEGITAADEYVQTEDFRDIVAETVAAVTREHYREKREALANYLCSATARQIDYEEHVRLRIVRTLDELSRAEIVLLYEIGRIQTPPTEHGIDVAFGDVGPRLGLSVEEFDDLARHLDRMGLLKIRATLARKDVNGRDNTAERISITDDGARFLRATE